MSNEQLLNMFHMYMRKVLLREVVDDEEENNLCLSQHDIGHLPSRVDRNI